jgi:cell cycle checkpoint protein
VSSNVPSSATQSGMDSPPPKRQRRLNLLSSDESDYEQDGAVSKQAPKTRASTKKTGSKANADVTSKCTVSSSSKSRPNSKSNGQILRKTSTTSSKASTPASSPDKKRSKSTVDTDGAKSKTLHTFFGKATEQQRWERKDSIDTPPAAGDLDDEIEDDSLDEALLLKLPDPPRDHKTVLDRRKRNHSEPRHNGTNHHADPAPNATQKFMKPALPRPKPLDGDLSSKPWTDEFAPTNLSELAVHKKKVMDVQTWLADVFAGRERRVCILVLLCL